MVKQLKGEKDPKDTKDANAAGKKGTCKGNAAGTGAPMKPVALQLEEAVVHVQPAMSVQALSVLWVEQLCATAG